MSEKIDLDQIEGAEGLGFPLSNLTTTDKTSLVDAINEINSNSSTSSTKFRRVIFDAGNYTTTGVLRIDLGNALNGWLKIRLTAIYHGVDISGYIEVVGGIMSNNNALYTQSLRCTVSNGLIRSRFAVDPQIKRDTATGQYYIELYKKHSSSDRFYVDFEYRQGNSNITPTSWNPVIHSFTESTPPSLTNEVTLYGNLEVEGSTGITTASHGNSSQWNAAYNWGRGLRVDGNGVAVHNVVGADVNLQENSSFYATGLNRPNGQNGSIVNFTPYSNGSSKYGFDLAKTASSNRLWFRSQDNNVYSNWFEIYHTGNFNPADSIQVLSTGSGYGQVLLSGGGGQAVLTSLLNTNRADANENSGLGGLKVYTNTTNSLNYPSISGGGIVINDTGGRYFEIWKSNSYDYVIRYRTRNSATEYGDWKIFADRDWTNSQLGGYLPLSGGTLDTDAHIGLVNAGQIQKFAPNTAGGWARNTARIFDSTRTTALDTTLGYLGNGETVTYGFIGGLTYNSVNAIRWTTDGKVGIGLNSTNAPTANLDVNGSVRFRNLANGFLKTNSEGVVSIDNNLYALLSQVYTQTQSLGLFVGLNGVQTIAGTKTFSSSPIVPNATLNSHAVNLGQLTSLLNEIELTPGPQGIQGIPGATGAQGPQGATGAQGQQGIQGIAGVDGKTWHSSTGVPANSLGGVGDFHLNTSNWDVREKTGASVWTLRGNIKGTPGAQGIQGPQGATGAQGIQGIAGVDGAEGLSIYTTTASISGSTLALSSVVVPSGRSVKIGDLIISSNSASLGFLKRVTATGSTLTLAAYATLRGPQGAQGIQGATGATGAQGIQGPPGPQGPAGTSAGISSRSVIVNTVLSDDPTEYKVVYYGVNPSSPISISIDSTSGVAVENGAEIIVQSNQSQGADIVFSNSNVLLNSTSGLQTIMMGNTIKLPQSTRTIFVFSTDHDAYLMMQHSSSYYN